LSSHEVKVHSILCAFESLFDHFMQYSVLTKQIYETGVLIVRIYIFVTCLTYQRNRSITRHIASTWSWCL